jgi:hypothetical protein
MLMSNTSRREYLESIKPRYREASKDEKNKILDEFCNICGYNRKYAIRVLNQKSSPKCFWEIQKRGPKKKYDHPDILKVLTKIWVNTNLPCSKRLKVIIPIWLPHYPYHVTEKIREALLTISPATIDRLLAKSRFRYTKRGLATTKPGSILKKHIPVKTKQWDETRPGFIEVDSVAHCGDSVAGMFVYTIDSVDIASGWTEQRATWSRGERSTVISIKSIEESLPFRLLGFDCDNGSEFLNWHLVRYLTKRKQPVNFTRSRAYYKNDNAHIEQKNWTNIRQYLGYGRFDNPILVDLLNDLYTSEWRLYFNFFIPSMKLIAKRRSGSKTEKVYDKPKTPFQRIQESDSVNNKIKNDLTKQYKELDPFHLQKIMSQKIKNIINIANQTLVKNVDKKVVIHTY